MERIIKEATKEATKPVKTIAKITGSAVAATVGERIASNLPKGSLKRRALEKLIGK